jgi:hypothetical protein
MKKPTLTATDRIRYASIREKVYKGKISELTDEEYEWLKHHPEFVKNVKKQRQKVEILKHCDDVKDTIEEILFVLDLSDRMLR